MQQKTEISIQSIWQKGDKICRITSTGELKRVSTFRFSGYNPFPCFSMQSTFTVISKWMQENGWERKPGGYRDTTTTISEDGKVSEVYRTKEIFVPVPEEAVK